MFVNSLLLCIVSPLTSITTKYIKYDEKNKDITIRIVDVCGYASAEY